MLIFNILLTLFFVLLNGFFVAAEFAIVKVRQSQLELRIRAGSYLAKFAKNLTVHLDAYLSATQLGITLASLGLGWIGESVVSKIIIDIMHFIGINMEPHLAHKIALPIAFILITILHIVFGELAPKSLAIRRAESVSVAIAFPLRLFYIVFSPFIWLLNSFANMIVKMLGFEPVTEEQELHSAEEIRYLLEKSSKSGIIDITEHKMLENVFEFSDTPVKQIMVPHNKVVGVDFREKPEDILDVCIEEGMSRMPIFDGAIDKIIGVIYAKDILSMMRHRELIIIQDIIRPAFFVHEEEKISNLLHDLQLEKIHLAIVVDEFGGTAGIVTLEDILEEIVGEIQDEYDEEQPIVEQLADNIFKVDASAPVVDVNEYLPEELPESEDYETVGGMIMHEIGRIPEKNETLEFDNFKFKIMKRSKRNLELIRLTILNPKEEIDAEDI